MLFPEKSVLWTVMLCLPFAPLPASAKSKGEVVMLRIATTPSLHYTGLLSTLLAPFELKNKEKVVVVPVETEKAFNLARNGEVDVVIVNDPESEASFMEDGFGVNHTRFMHSYFMIVGPPNDPAKIKGEKANYAFYKISEKKAPFISSGDDSEIHKKEKRLWESVEINKKGGWYSETRKGVEEALMLADDKKGYTLADRYVYAFLKNMIKLVVLTDKDDPYLKNVYSVIAVNPKRFTYVKYGSAQMLIEYLTSQRAKEIISGYKINGEQLFYAGE